MGIIDGSAEAVLLPLLEKSLLRVQGVALLPLDFSEKQSKGSKTVTSDIFLNVFGRPEFADAVGLFLSDNGLFLQHPKYPEGGYRYQNPHVFSRRFENVITENTITGGLPVLSTVRATDTSVSSAPGEILDFFDNVFKFAVLEEARADWRITTELLRQDSHATLCFVTADSLFLSHQKQGLYFLQRREQGLSSFDTSGTTDDKHIWSAYIPIFQFETLAYNPA
jgi:SWI/SNF-related matrix-associated actin-dependent regulator of chromatin subfamily A3